MNWIKFRARLANSWEWLRDKALFPAMKKTGRFLLRIPHRCDPPKDFDPRWKQQALQDFTLWLEDLPDCFLENGKTEMDTCDLYSVLKEFTALRQEIKFQTRQQHKTIQTHEDLVQAFKDNIGLFDTRTQQLERLEERIRLAAEKKAVMPFLDIRDALVRGLNATRQVSRSRGFFRKPPKGVESIVEGYEMALRRFDRAMAGVGITAINALGEPFDPAVMKASDKRHDPQKPPGIVLEEYLGGFMRGREVIRSAEVAVNFE